MLKTLTALATLTAATLGALPARADAGHQALWNAVESVGVEVRVNQINDCDPNYNGIGRKVFGWYHGALRTLVVCQEMAHKTGRYGQGQFAWTAEDLDTLRHEAHHMVQDCRDNLLDQELQAVYKDPIGLAVEWLGKEKAVRVVEAYADSTEHIQVMELEAFAVAAMNDPAEQVRDIRRYCF